MIRILDDCGTMSKVYKSYLNWVGRLLFSRTKVIDMDSRVFYMKSCERHQGVGDTIN